MQLEKKALCVYEKLHESYGDVTPELNYSNLFQLTIAVILSAQTTDRQVNSVTPTLFSKFPDFLALSEAKIEEVEKVIHATGFYRNKAKNIVSLAKTIIIDCNGTLPETIDELIKLPGIGRKSANVIISQGMNIPGLAVDTHVSRIAGRLDLTSQNNPDRIEADLKSIFPETLWSSVHLLFIFHGRTICTARKPACHRCPIYSLCSFPGKTP